MKVLILHHKWLAKQTFVAKIEEESNEPLMVKVCQWYSPQEKEWLWDNIWNISLISQSVCLIVGLLGVGFLGLASCCSVHMNLFRVMSITFGIIAVINMTPLMIYWKSDLCTTESVCNEYETSCVTSCKMGDGR